MARDDERMAERASASAWSPDASAEPAAPATLDAATTARRGRLAGLTIAITAVFAVCDLALLPSSTLVFASENWTHLARMTGAVAAGALGGAAVRRRFRDDPSRIGRFVRDLGHGLVLLSVTGFAFVTFSCAAGLFMYLASNTTAPLIDRELAAADAALGFDWVRCLAIANASPLVARTLVLAYFSTGPLLGIAFVILSFTRRERRLMELVALVAVTSLCTGALLYFLPAEGAYGWFRPDRSLFDNFPETAGMWHHRVLTALRSERPVAYVQSRNTGLVTFPSFHTQLGIVTAYAVRGIPVVFPAVTVVSATMIVSTIPYGGHYLIDVIAGGAIAALGILAVRAWAR